ncbi:uncharacterized protein LOC131597678 [Vicia villosa]|uniref:uncharacterized protein LOC131597678 n=1 Tax=Vicia villosa TaxID=3911 RepID=UPI00273AEC15|nr:uncharacterized protein LOC131597678 [Vicia villosa]
MGAADYGPVIASSIIVSEQWDQLGSLLAAARIASDAGIGGTTAAGSNTAPISSSSSGLDSFSWRLESSGFFSVASIAKALARDKDNAWQPATIGLLSEMWKVFIPPKIQFFAWRLFIARLPVKDLLLSRGVDLTSSDPMCVLCGSQPESLAHLFFFCNVSKTMWSRKFLWVGIASVISLEVFMDFGILQTKVKSLKDRRRLNIIWIATSWSLWCMRNAIIFEQGQYSFDVVYYNVMFYSWSWLATKSMFSPSSSFFDWYMAPLDYFSDV